MKLYHLLPSCYIYATAQYKGYKYNRTVNVNKISLMRLCCWWHICSISVKMCLSNAIETLLFSNLFSCRCLFAVHRWDFDWLDDRARSCVKSLIKCNFFVRWLEGWGWFFVVVVEVSCICYTCCCVSDEENCWFWWNIPTFLELLSTRSVQRM